MPQLELVAAFVRSAQEPSIDAARSVLHKLSLGMLDTVLHAIKRRHRLDEVWSAAQIYEFVDEQQRLIGRSEVCAAPKRLFIDFMGEVLDVLASPTTTTKAAIDSDAHRSIPRLSGVHWKLHCFSLVYETLRLANLLGNKESVASLGPKDLSRHAMPYFGRAMTAAQASEPLRSGVVTEFTDIAWRYSSTPAVDRAFHAFLAVADRANDSGPAMGLELRERSFDFLTVCDRALHDLIGLGSTHPAHEYCERDLTHFFGESFAG
jgi:hypothetical protein